MTVKRVKALTALAMLFMGMCLGLFSAKAEAGTVCAQITLNIAQEATLEREAFDAALGVTNEFPNYGLEDFRVDVVIKDPAGNSADNLFFTKVNSKDGITAVDGTGIIQPATTASVHWLIIPSTGAGGTNPLGIKYSVKADISYKLNGVYQSISTFEDFITVKPQPALKLEYVLPFEVFGDEPLTQDVVESVEPFALGLRITNVGYGTAKNLKVASGQPEVAENRQGLAEETQLLGTYVGGNKIADTLLIPFGDVAAGGVKQAAWLMSTALSGRFIKFDASFSHADELGGQLTSLVQEVNTYTLVKDVLVDLPGRDAQFDFLVNTNTSRETMYETLSAGGEVTPNFILESDQAVPLPVERLNSQITGALGGANTAATLKLTGTSILSGWIYTSIPAPMEGKAKLLSAIRSDGKTINAKNVWIFRHFNKTTLSYIYRLNLLDYNPPPLAEYSLNFSRGSIDVPPAPVADLSAFRIVASGQAGLNWSATGEDGATGAIFGGHYLIQTTTSSEITFSTASAQISFSTNTTPGMMQNYVLAGLAGNATHYFKVWLEDTGGNISEGSNLTQVYVQPNPPRELLAGAISSSSVAVAWAGGDNVAPIEYSVWLDTDAVEPAVGSSPFKDPLSLTYEFAGLTPNTTYFISGLAKNPDTGAMSAQAALGSTVTLAALPGTLSASEVFVSSISIAWGTNGNPTWTEYTVQISTESDFSALAAGSAWNTAASRTFNGLIENTTYYARVKARNSTGAETGFVSLGAFKTQLFDTLAPVTGINFSGPRSGIEPVYVSSLTEIVLSAADDVSVVGDLLGAVAAVNYSVDSDTYAVYSGSFSITTKGAHLVRYYAIDAAGNTEAVKTSSVTLDNTAPGTYFAVQGSSRVINGNLYVMSGASVSLTAEDSLSGAKEIYYNLDSSTGVAVSPWVLLVSPGAHALSFHALDYVGNIENEHALAFYTDTDTPVSTASMAGLAGLNGWHVSPVTLTLTSTDAMSGVLAVEYNLERLAGEERLLVSSGVYSKPIAVESEGSYAYTYNSADGAGNVEAVQSGSFKIDLSTPVVIALSTPAANANGWSKSVVDVVFSGTDPVSGIAYCTYAARLETEGSSQTVTGYCADFAGLASTVSVSVSIDTSAPVCAATLSGAQSGGYYSSYVTVVLEAVDALAGVDKTYYILDGGTETVYSSPISVSLSGAHNITFYSIDRAGNVGKEENAAFSIEIPVSDTTAPVTHLWVNGQEIADGGTNYMLATDSISIIATDDGSGVAGIRYTLDAPFVINTSTAYSGPFLLEAGVHTVYYTAFDNTRNMAEVKSSTIIVTSSAMRALLAPSSGPIGVPFVITGGDFGTYSANTTVVLIGGTTAPLTLWSTSTIKGTVPGTLSAGEQSVTVKRGTTTIASAQPFTVTVPTAAEITPSSGAIGVPFTVSGSGFGNYVANYTKVLIGGTTAALTLWTDTQIQGTVPGTLAAGDYELLVERELNGGTVATSIVAFKVVTPTLTAIVPSSGSIGVGFTLTGADFGNYVANFTRVLIGGTTAPLTLWTDSVISGTVPGSLASGTYEVAVERELNGGLVRTSTVAFTLVAPIVTAVAPSSGAIGAPFTISGSGFGNYVANYTKVLIGGATMPITLWSETKIQATVPGALVPGDYDLIVTRELNGGIITTQPVAFKVVAPEMAAITPSSGAIGLPFVITGASFGNYVTNYTRVLIGGTTAPLTLWTDTKIQGTIPGGLTGGENEVVVERALNGGVVRTSTFTFSLITPELAAVAPSSGPIGMPFVINGASFGNYVANNTKVLIGGATVPVSVWTDTKIQGTIPGSLAAGDYELVVVRALNGGEVRTSTAAFTVILPVISAVNPSTAAVIAPFTISGAGFGNYVANSTKVLINGATAPLTLWTDTYIQGKLPFLLNGTYPVLIQRSLNGGLAESGTAYITVAEPVISSMTPLSGAVGTVFNLYGASFGPYDASQTRVTIGGVVCALSLWNDTTIKGTVPTGLAVGTYTVVAMRGQALSNELAYTVPGAVRTSMLGPTSILQAEFKLGEVYVYPNPAKNGKVPVFHVEVGLADNVKIKVFTVSGQSVLERTLTGVPQAIDGKYAYEYAWEGHIASGVYYYTMEAERAGKKLKAKGKFAVVR